MVIAEVKKEKLSGTIPIEERAKHSEDCVICGAEATFRCAKCGSALCDDCKSNPCQWEHYAEPQDEEQELGSDEDPNYEEEFQEDE